MKGKKNWGWVLRVLIVVVVLGLGGISSSTASSAADVKNVQRWWKWMSPSPAASSSSSSPARVSPSSVVLPLYGNVYPQGFYFVEINIGNPPRPYYLDPDTGSDLTWLQCDAPCVHCTEGAHPLYRPSNDLVTCKDPLCASLHSADYKCDDPSQCDYEVEYADGGSSLGVLVNDVYLLNLTTGARITPRMSLGCGYDQLPSGSYQPLDGVLGLGKGKSSIVSQLHNQGLVKNVVGHCFSGRGGGFLFFGDDVYDPSRIVWTPLSRDYTKHYSAGFAEVTFDGKSTGLKNLLVIFDSGSSYTYLSSQAYQAFLYMVQKELNGKPLKDAVDDETLPFCWKGRKPFKNIRDVRKYFKPLALNFGSGWRAKTQFDIPPESYLIISSKGSVCLGILNGTEVGLKNFNVIGDISMRDKMVIYDNEKQAIGWMPANCDRIPNSQISSI